VQLIIIIIASARKMMYAFISIKFYRINLFHDKLLKLYADMQSFKKVKSCKNNNNQIYFCNKFKL